MKPTTWTCLIIVAALAAAEDAAPVRAQVTAGTPQTPRGWSYEVDKHGNRIARDNRVVKADGSWREEIRQGNCLTVKERSATGEYRETRQCSAPNPK